MANAHQRSGVLDVIGMLAGLAVFAGPLLGWLRVLPALAAFYLFALGGLISVIVAITGLVSAARGRGFGSGRTVALLGGLVFVFAAFGAPRGGPMTNDFTTNLDDPPAFANAATLPANVGRDLSYPAEFADQQRACCSDLRPARIAAPPADALRRAEQVARAMPGWQVTVVDEKSGTVEAIAESSIFGFQDDVIARVRPDGTGSIVDVRSKSRDGRGDMGVNAARIRAYVAALEQPAAR
jgi:uncharacterized protein (DUF1499 family)